ncbi:MAG TPA: hypothetical protein VN939_11805, partial [Chthoniobacterales bacterium]|nr:hypothetical protein [Chthoniobacterales bacterium]
MNVNFPAIGIRFSIYPRQTTLTVDLVRYKTRGRFYKPQWTYSLMWTSKIYLRIAAISLLSLASAAQVWAQ